MFATDRGDCAEHVTPVGLRDAWDEDAVLCCRNHYVDLRRLRPREAEILARYLWHEFNRPVPADEHDPLVLV